MIVFYNNLLILKIVLFLYNKKSMIDIDLSPLKNKKTGLVLSGGVVKAASWHLGVVLALKELGFTLKHNHSKESDLEISSYIGSSAGSLINLYLAAGYSPEDIIEANISTKKNRTLLPVTYRDMLYFKRSNQVRPKATKEHPLEGLPFFLKKILAPAININGIFTTEGLKKYIIKNLLHGEDKFLEDYKADLFLLQHNSITLERLSFLNINTQKKFMI